jgi:hypothetical protein
VSSHYAASFQCTFAACVARSIRFPSSLPSRIAGKGRRTETEQTAGAAVCGNYDWLHSLNYPIGARSTLSLKALLVEGESH